MFFTLFSIFFTIVVCKETNYTHHLIVDPEEKYEMWWTFDDEYITVKLKVESKGWIGWGLSSNGNMIGSDIILMWFDANGAAKIQDTHTVLKQRPTIDSQQDAELVEMKKEGSFIMVEFKRKLTLCNKEDRSITEDTQRLIYAYGDSQQPSYHQNRRGAHSLLLLDYGKKREKPLPNDTITIDFLMNDDVALRPTRTVYMCKLFKVDHFQKKHHLIRVAPVIQKGHENIVHHILIYKCSIKDEKHLNGQEECQSRNMPKHFKDCDDKIVHAWAIGGMTIDYPDEAGLPFSDEHETKYILMIVHYDNPLLKVGLKDKSGFRLYLTPTLRQFDAGILAVGSNVDKYAPLIPQNQAGFVWKSYCSSDCLPPINASSPPKIFAAELHAHVQARKLLLRQVRDSDGVEVKRISQDLNYDFNFQDMKRLKNPIDILPGHTFVMECTYNTEQHDKPVVGGEGTNNEMCFGFMWIYPKFPVDNSFCVSINVAVFYEFPVVELGWKIHDKTFIVEQDLILDGKNYKGMKSYEALAAGEVWRNNNSLVQTYQTYMRNPLYLQYCNPSKIYSTTVTKTLPDDACVGGGKNTNKATTLDGKVGLFIFLQAIILIMLGL